MSGGSSGDDLAPETIARYKQAAARAAAELVLDGMAVGLGTGSTVAYLLSALGERAGELRGCRCVATSPATARIARELGLNVGELDEVGELDIALDGADQIDPDGWLIKGGGGAHTREKIVAASARRFVVIVSAEKLVPRLHPPVPLEVLRFGMQRTLAAIGQARARVDGDDGAVGDRGAGVGAGAGNPAQMAEDRPTMVSPDGNLLAWYEGSVGDVRELATRLSATPGLVEHGLFSPDLVSEVLIAGANGVHRRAGGMSARASDA